MGAKALLGGQTAKGQQSEGVLWDPAIIMHLSAGRTHLCVFSAAAGVGIGAVRLRSLHGRRHALLREAQAPPRVPARERAPCRRPGRRGGPVVPLLVWSQCLAACTDGLSFDVSASPCSEGIWYTRVPLKVLGQMRSFRSLMAGREASTFQCACSVKGGHPVAVRGALFVGHVMSGHHRKLVLESRVGIGCHRLARTAGLMCLYRVSHVVTMRLGAWSPLQHRAMRHADSLAYSHDTQKQPEAGHINKRRCAWMLNPANHLTGRSRER